MRTFITFDFDKKTKESIAEIQKIIKTSSKKGRFKYYDNFHLTIKFLGETNLEVVEKLYTEFLKKLRSNSKISIWLEGIDAFGIGNTIRTIYLNAHGEIDKLKEIAEKVDEITNNLGFKRENKFIPHVTIAQDVELNIPFDELKERLKDVRIENIIFDKIIIMKSEEINKKRIYTPLKTLFLK